ncbi:histidine kinase [Spirosoma sp. KCTC 42546]|uniref:sensor histidine kinase n=1 Tax=Spirosoma sp. KCTC 42546 TaxID=2520506 RepID=UPI00115876F5|nr:sensor histidine kinase [Spirosoma sp. KCTC 42546]QDK79501.1 histidine kinase [Spirosoma sp. KCTC 42546]
MNRRIALGFIVAMVLIASGFIISFYSYNQYSEDTKRVRHTYEVTGTLEKILSLVKDVETGSRGYILTNDASYLAPYRTALTLLPEQINQLRLLGNDNRIQIQRRITLEKLVRDKLAVTKTRIGIGVSDKRSQAISAESKRSMDALRRHVALMVETERIIMDSRNRQAARSFRNTLIIIFGLSLLTFMALAISYRLLEQELIYRQTTEDQLREYEGQLKGQIRQLETSNEELERFAFVASHDLQEPLRKIQSFSNLITDRYGNLFDEDSMLFMSKISHSAERMSKLIKDLLNFSRISNHQENFKSVPLGDIIQRILDDQELRIKGLDVAVEVGEMPVIQAVASQMDHLFTNLISNALKFTRPGIRPSLRIQARSINGDDYAGLTPDRPYVEITIEDNGIGFEEKYLDHIFKVFQRLHGKTAFEGTGIGLAICKRVVMYHHGFITARSQPTQGATFVVVLPESQSLQHYDRPTSTETYSYPAR